MLSQMRQHCTEKPFQNDTGYSLAARRAVNAECCDCCYCYICDVPAWDCQGNWKEDHCLATDQGSQKEYWHQRREDAQKNGVPAAAASAAAIAPGELHLRHECPNHQFSKPNHEHETSGDFNINVLHCTKCCCYVCDKPVSQCEKWENTNNYYYSPHCHAFPGKSHWDINRQHTLERDLGPGPFAPDHEAVVKDQSLSKCRHCGWFSRPSDYSQTLSDDFCHACGRIAHEKNLGNGDGVLYKPKSEDFLLGTKEIAFRLKTHDPRKLSKYLNRWSEKEGQPGWDFDESAHMEDLFQYLVTSSPSLTRILPRIGVEDPETTESWDYSGCIILDDPVDLIFLREIKRNSSDFGGKPPAWRSSSRWAFAEGDIRATWDPTTQKGVSIHAGIDVVGDVLGSTSPHTSNVS